MTDEITFLRRACGRIAVHGKCYNTLTEVETCPRLGTITYHISSNEYLFAQTIIHGYGTRLDAEMMIIIGNKLKEMNTKWKIR